MTASAQALQNFLNTPLTFTSSSADESGFGTQMRVISTLKAWLEEHWKFDFENNPPLQNALLDFMKELQGPTWGARAAQINSLIQRVSEPQKSVIPYKLPDSHSYEENFDASNLFVRIGDFTAVEFARQLSIFNFRLYEKIAPCELLNQCWNKENKEERAPNVIRLIRQFNLLSRWTAQNVVSHPLLSNRVTALKFFIQLSEELLKNNDLFTLVCIQSGLGSTAVNRLTKTWKALGSGWDTRWQQLKNMTNTDNNYAILRYHIANSDPPILPFVGSLLFNFPFVIEHLGFLFFFISQVYI